VLAARFETCAASVCRLVARVREALADVGPCRTVAVRRRVERQRACIEEALLDRRTLGHGGRKPLLSVRVHGACVRSLLRREVGLYLGELREELVARRFFTSDAAPSVSTICRFVNGPLAFTRKRSRSTRTRAGAKTAANMQRRREFVARWFGASATQALVGSGEREYAEQTRRWRCTEDERRVFFLDETGVNEASAERRYGRAPRGHECHRGVGDTARKRGPNHSVLLTIGVDEGVLASEVLVGRGRGTRRVDFVSYLTRKKVVPSIVRVRPSASSSAPLFLLLDNASIHHGDIVRKAVHRSSRGRVTLVYLPPYAPTFNPIELANAELKAALRATRRAGTVSESLRVRIESVLREKLIGRSMREKYAHCGWLTRARE